MNKNKRTMDRLPDYLAMIRDNGMIPGLSAHMPEVIQYADLNGYDVETYISSIYTKYFPDLSESFSLDETMFLKYSCVKGGRNLYQIR